MAKPHNLPLCKMKAYDANTEPTPNGFLPFGAKLTCLERVNKKKEKKRKRGRHRNASHTKSLFPANTNNMITRRPIIVRHFYFIVFLVNNGLIYSNRSAFLVRIGYI